MNRQLFARVRMLLLVAVLAVPLLAQDVTVNVTQEGGLWDALEAKGITDFTTVKNLTVTGTMGENDFMLIKNQMSNLESIDISGTDVTEIPGRSFSDKEYLAKVRLPEKITYFREQAFFNCQKLESVTFGNQTAVIGKIVFPTSLRNIESSTFNYCIKLTHLDFSACASLEYLGGDAFRNLFNLKEVLFPSQGSLRLDWSCFYVDNTWDEATQQWIYKGLETLTLTKAVTHLSGYSLPRTLKTLFVESTTPPSCDEDAFNPFFENETVLLKVYIPKGSKKNYAVTNGWSKLYQYMQEVGLNVNISGYGIIQKGNNNYGNGDVFFPTQGSATTLKALPDMGCELISVKLDGNSLTVGADGTFTVPAGAVIGTLEVAFTANMITIDNPNGGELSKKITDLGLNPKTMHTLKITGKVNNADWKVISSLMKTLEAVDLSETNIQEIPNDAFRELPYLHTCRLPESIRYIRNAAFYNCKALKTLSFGKLDDNVFPSSLLRIEEHAFSGCSMIEKADLSACTLLESLDNYCFRNCPGLKDVILPKIGSFGIGWEAFRNSGLSSFTMTKAVNNIRCYFLPDNLKVIYVESSTPINTEGTCCFENLDVTALVVYVPKGSKSNYALNEHWAYIESNIQERGILINISGFGTIQQGNVTYKNGDVFFAQNNATTLKAVPEVDCELISVTLDGNALNVGTDGTFTIPAGTTMGTLNVTFTANATTIDNPNGGELKAKITALGRTPGTIRALKVVGKMTSKDWTYVKNSLTALEDFNISATDVKSVPEQAFNDNQVITAVHLPSTVTAIGNSAFNNCPQLVSVEGCENVQEIGSSAFRYCRQLKVFPFGDNIKKIESEAFNECTSLPETLVMPASLGSFGWNDIFSGSSILSFDLSQCTLTGSIAYNTFGECTSLLLPEKGEYSLSCSALRNAKLTELRLPASVRSLDCDNVLPTMLERLYVSSIDPIRVNNKNAFDNVDLDNCTLYIPIETADAYSEASGWSLFTKVQEYGFKISISGYGSVQQGNITYANGSVCMPSQGSAVTLTTVPDNGCQLISVTLDGNALEVNTDGSFTIPATTTIGTITVAFTSSQTVANNPNGGELKDVLTAMGVNIRQIRGLKVVGKMTTKDWNFVKNNLTTMEELDISETDVKSVPEQALQEHQRLTNIRLPQTVTSIGNSAFYNCPQLSVVTGCENVQEIGSSAFRYCRQLKVFPFGDNIKRIESEAFNECTSLPETLVMPASLGSFGWNDIFSGSSIRSFDLSQCTLTGNIADNTFGECTSLLLPEKGEYSLSCSALRNAKLTELRLPASVRSLDCDNVLPTLLERLYVSSIEPIRVDSKNAFDNIDFDNCTLYVPVGSTGNYEVADGWSNFTKIIEYGMQVTVAEQGKVRAGSQTLMGTSTFFPTENTVTFEIIPNAGWHAGAVTLDGTNVPFANNMFTLSSSQLSGKLKIDFAVNQFQLNLQIAGDGQVKMGALVYKGNQTLTVDSLATLNFTLEPAEGQVVSNITFNGEESVVQNGGKNYVTPAITSDSKLAITFGAAGAQGDIAVYTVKTGEGGSVEYKNTTLLPETTINLLKGQDAVFAMKPDQYYIVDAVKLNGENITNQLDADGKLTVKNVTDAANLEVTFRINAEIAVTMEDGGTLTNMLSEKQKATVTKLTVKGQMWESDFRAMRDEMPLLEEIDLWEAKTDYIPYQAFCTTQNWDGNSTGKKTLTKVRLPETTRNISGFAFAGCMNLKDINFTELKNLEYMDSYSFESTSLQVIDLRNTKLTEVNGAFRNVKNIEDIKFPQTMTRLGNVFSQSTLSEIDLSNCTNLKTLDGTFNECKNLVKVTLPEGLTTISGSAFSNCEALTTVNFPKSLQSIGGWSFNNTKLEKVDLSELTELQSIGEYAFYNNQELTDVIFPSSLERLGNNAFYYCRKLTSVDLSKTQLRIIPNGAFSSCESLESVKMPKTLESIGNNAFAWNNKLGGVLELASTVTSIGESAFADTQISVVKSEAIVPPTLSNNSMPDAWVAAFVPEGYAETYKAAPIWEDKVILDKEVHADVTVSKEGNLAIDINEQAGISPALVTHLKVHGPLGVQDFAIMRENMTVLYDLDMSDAEVSVIPENAFNSVKKKVLMNIKLPASLLRIEANAFYGCSGLNGSLSLPSGLKFIGWGAFRGCTSLDEVVLNENLEVIQGYAFEGCSSLTQEITLPRDFQSLGERAFANCSSLYGTVKFNRDFYMFMGTEGYGSSAGSCFENCSKIETVDMSEPDFLDEIPYGTFAGCTSLKTVLLPPMLDRIDNNAFYNCKSLDNIEFPNKLRVINYSAFRNCTSLSSVNLSDCKDLGTIEGYAFHGCSNLETVYLPKNLNWIREYAFADCRKLANLTVEALQPADLGEYVFRHVHTDRCVLSIPTGTFYDYLSAAQWGEFVSMRKSIDVTVGEGANLYFWNDESESSNAPRRAPSAGQNQQGAKVKDGSSLYVQENEKAIFKVNPDENVQIAKVLFNGQDVTDQLVNGTYQTPGVTDASSFEVQVNVVGDIHVKELRMLDDEVAVKQGENRQLRFAVYPTNATNKSIEWTCSDETVATVNSEGVITGVAPGKVEITAKTVDGGFEEKCQIIIMSNNYWLVMDNSVENYVENTINLPLALHNEGEARDIQFDVYMPSGVNMANMYGNFNIQKSGRASGHNVVAARTSDGAVRVVVYSQSGIQFQGSDGELLTLPFTTGKETGSFDVTIKNIHISGPDNFDFVAPNHTIHFNLNDYPLGDSNGNGEISINDATNTVDQILERTPSRFIRKAADVNMDGDITVSDVTATIDIILERTSSAPSRTNKAAPVTSDDKVFIDNFKLGNGKQQTINLQLTNTDQYTAFQCDIILPEGLKIAEDDGQIPMINISNANARNHIVQANYVSNDVLRLLVMSMNNTAFAADGNNVVSLTFEANAETLGQKVISIENVRLVNVVSHTESFAPNTQATVDIVDGLTGVQSMTAVKDTKIRVEGHDIIVTAESDGVLRLTSMDGNQRMLQIRAGEQRFFVSQSGVYVIEGRKIVIK